MNKIVQYTLIKKYAKIIKNYKCLLILLTCLSKNLSGDGAGVIPMRPLLFKIT